MGHRLTTILFITALFAALALPTSALTQTPPPKAPATDSVSKLKHVCTDLKIKSSKDASFCISEMPGSKSTEVIFFFHPRGGSEQDWVVGHIGRNLRKHWDSKKIEHPKVVTISFGKTAVLIAKNSKRRSGRLETFYSEVLPVIEKQIYPGNRTHDKPLLFGYSMGGFNAIQVYFHKQNYWKRLALINPAVSTSSFSPFSTYGEIRALAEKHNLGTIALLSAKIHGRMYFATEAEWLAVSPIELVKKQLLQTSPEIYMGCATRDKFGFYLGCREIAAEAKQVSNVLTLNLLKNKGHGSFKKAALSDFLLK